MTAFALTIAPAGPKTAGADSIAFRSGAISHRHIAPRPSPSEAEAPLPVAVPADGETCSVAQEFETAAMAEQSGSFDVALAAYREYLGRSSDNVHAHVARLKSRTIADAVASRDESGLAEYLRAIDARVEGRFEDAIDECRWIISNTPDSRLADDALHLMAHIQLVDLGASGTALLNYVELIEDYPDSTLLSNALYGRAIALERSGDLDGALSAFTRLRDEHSVLSGFGMNLSKANLLSKVWHRKATASITRLAGARVLQESSLQLLTRQSPVFGTGSRLILDQPVGSGENHRGLWHLVSEYDLPVSHLTHWITRHTDWRWETKQRLHAATRRGYTPVIAYWWFGDEISPDFVERNLDEWYAEIRNKLIPMIRELPDVYVLLEPEFNKNGIAEWDRWDAIASRAIQMIKQEVPQARIGLTLGSWGEFESEGLAVRIEESVAASDFVGVMAMTSRVHDATALDPSWNVVERSKRVVAHIADRYGKPVYFGYLAISTAGNWEDKQARYIEQMINAVPQLAGEGVFALSFFSLFDHPEQDGWFAEAEQAFGLVDAKGNAKAGLESWREATARIVALDEASPRIVGDPTVSAHENFDGEPTGGMAIEANLNEWARWRLEISGTRSGARFTAQGAGTRVFVDWDGHSETKSFTRENLSIELTAVDRAGNKTTVDTWPEVRVTAPQLLEYLPVPAFAALDGIVEWSSNTTLVELDEPGAVRAKFDGSGVAGASVTFKPPMAFNLRQVRGHPIAGANCVDLEPLVREGKLEMRVRLAASGDGLYFGIEDEAGTRTDVLAEAYLPDSDDEDEWIRIAIPLRDFAPLGSRVDHFSRTQWQPVDWTRGHKLVITSVARPISVDIRQPRFAAVRAKIRVEIGAAGPNAPA